MKDAKNRAKDEVKEACRHEIDVVFWADVVLKCADFLSFCYLRNEHVGSGKLVQRAIAL